MANNEKIEVLKVQAKNLEAGMILLNIGKIHLVEIYKNAVVVRILYNLNIKEMSFSPYESLFIDANPPKFTNTTQK